MPAEIYYFSGTGNSLAVARQLAEKTAGRLSAIPAVRPEASLKPAAEVVGLVFPVYHGGLPLAVTRAVQNWEGLAGKYLFGVCTYGDSPGLTMEYLDQLVRARGGMLAAGFGVHMPYNYITPSVVLRGFLSSFKLREIPAEKQAVLWAEGRKKVDVIAAFVNARRSGALETDAELISRLVDAVHLKESLGKAVWLKIAGVKAVPPGPFVESRQWMDEGFHAGEQCNGCGVCAKVCPAEDIVMMRGRPVWQHRCEQCFACLQWCPREALQFGRKTEGGKRYHYPEVKLADMLRRTL